MFDLPSRNVRQSHEFEEQLARLIFDPESAGDFVAAAEEMLARDPLNGMPVSKDGVTWYLPMCPIRGKRVSIFYSFDEVTVTLESILAYDD